MSLRGVPQHGRHHRHRRAVADHGHGQRAAQGMHPADLARRELDPGAGGVPRQPGGDRGGAPERVERVTVLDEHLRAGRLGTAASDVVDDRPADVVQQRQAQRPARLVLDDRDLLRPPVQVAQFEAAQIRDPQAQPGGRQDHRVVAFAGGGLTVDPGQQPADLIRGPQVRVGLVTDVPVRRQPIRQALRRPARRGQEAPGSRPGTTSWPRWSCAAVHVDAARSPTRPARRAPRDHRRPPRPGRPRTGWPPCPSRPRSPRRCRDVGTKRGSRP